MTLEHAGEVLALGGELDDFTAVGANHRHPGPRRFQICNPPATYLGCLADGTSWQEIDPDFFQPSRSNHVRGWYTTSGS